MAESKAKKTQAKSTAKQSTAKQSMAKQSTVNMRGLKCPLPALKARKLLSRMAAGELLVIECTDPLTSIDIPNLIRETGDTMEGSARKGRVLTFRVRKS